MESCSANTVSAGYAKISNSIFFNVCLTMTAKLFWDLDCGEQLQAERPYPIVANPHRDKVKDQSKHEFTKTSRSCKHCEIQDATRSLLFLH